MDDREVDDVEAQFTQSEPKPIPTPVAIADSKQEAVKATRREVPLAFVGYADSNNDSKLQSSDLKDPTVHNKGLKKTTSKIAHIRLVASHPEVYEPCDDSFALVDALLADQTNLSEHKPAICMEVGCGSGYVITSLALILGQEADGIHYFATDINPHAVSVTQETLGAHGVHTEVIMTNIASGLEKRLAGLVDVMVVNPPYVPTPEAEVGAAGITASWAGGENGRSVIDKILPIADKLLSDRGWLYMVTLTANNPSQICGKMREMGYASKIVVQRSTVEESLQIIKFWRDSDAQLEVKNASTTRSMSTKIMDSVLSQFPRLSFWSISGNDPS